MVQRLGQLEEVKYDTNKEVKSEAKQEIFREM